MNNLLPCIPVFPGLEDGAVGGDDGGVMVVVVVVEVGGGAGLHWWGSGRRGMYAGYFSLRGS